MRGYINFGNDSRDNGLNCGMEGALLNQRNSVDTLGPGPTPPAYRCAYVSPEDVRRHETKARHFILTLLALAAFPAGLAAAARAGMLTTAEGEPGSVAVTLLIPGLIVYVFVLYGFLIAKTGESAGAPFFPNFLMGCIPPLTPALWARLGGRPATRAYLYLIFDAAVLVATYWLGRDWPFLLVLIVMAMVPLIVYHMLGCATGPLAGAMGIPPVILTIWLCVAPDILLGMAIWDFLAALDPTDARQSFALTLAEIKLYLNPDYLMSYNHFKIAAFVYLMVTLSAWAKIVHDNLKLPPT